MVDSTQMEKFEFDKSNQTYLGNNSKNNDNENNFDESNQTYLGNKSYNISNNNNFEKSNQTYLGNNNKNINYENGFIFFLLLSDLPLGGPPFGIQKWEVPEDGLFT